MRGYARGDAAVLICPGCEAWNRNDATVCPSCGAPIRAGNFLSDSVIAVSQEAWGWRRSLATSLLASLLISLVLGSFWFESALGLSISVDAAWMGVIVAGPPLVLALTLHFLWLLVSRSEDIVFDGRRRRVEIRRFRLREAIEAQLIPFACIESVESEKEEHDVWSQHNERATQPERQQSGHQVWMTYREGERTRRKSIGHTGFYDDPKVGASRAEDLVKAINELLGETHAETPRD